MLKPRLLLLLWHACAVLFLCWTYIVSVCVMTTTRTYLGGASSPPRSKQ